MMYKAYKYRIYPTDEQKVLLAKHFGCARWMYNYGLAIKTKAYQQGKKLTCRDIADDLVSLKSAEETQWLKEVNSQSLQMALRNLDNAYTKFFREKKGFPKFKSRHDNNQSFQCPQRVRLENDKIIIPKFSEGIEAVIHRSFEGKIKTVTISKNVANRYFASVLVDNEKPLPDKLQVKNVIGLDLGLEKFCTISDGRTIENPRFLKQDLVRLAFLQRGLAKKQKDSSNREKHRLKIARLHEHITNCRKDFLHKTSANIIYDNQIDTICLETLNVKSMMANRTLAKEIGDASWSNFVRMLEYKAEWSGKNVYKIGRFEPSSKTCSRCGIIKPMPLNERTYQCSCGLQLDRDINAALNVRNFALLSHRISGKDVAVESVKLPKTKNREVRKFTPKSVRGASKQKLLTVKLRSPYF